jgi:hypothetical protein
MKRHYLAQLLIVPEGQEAPVWPRVHVYKPDEPEWRTLVRIGPDGGLDQRECE